MKKNDLYGKTAFSVEGKELGTIVSVKQKKNLTTQKKTIEIVIHHSPILKKEAYITLTINSVKKVTNGDIFLNISYEQFKLKVADYHHQKKSFKKKKEEKYHERVTKGLDRGYYHKKRKGEW